MVQRVGEGQAQGVAVVVEPITIVGNSQELATFKLVICWNSPMN